MTAPLAYHSAPPCAERVRAERQPTRRFMAWLDEETQKRDAAWAAALARYDAAKEGTKWP